MDGEVFRSYMIEVLGKGDICCIINITLLLYGRKFGQGQNCKVYWTKFRETSQSGLFCAARHRNIDKKNKCSDIIKIA